MILGNTHLGLAAKVQRLYQNMIKLDQDPKKAERVDNLLGFETMREGYLHEFIPDSVFYVYQ